MTLTGFVLLVVTCYGSEYNCDSKPVNSEVFATESRCEFERQAQSAYYPIETLTCATVYRSQ